MNRPSLLHIIERLEGFLGKLPETIQRPVLHELTPLKELFLQQRAPRFVLTGSNRLPLQEVVAALFAWVPPADSHGLLMELFRWHAMDLSGRGTASFLDARGADPRTIPTIQEELKTQPADMLLHLADDGAVQSEIAQMLVKSTTAICAAIGAQPIPLADLPILTALQLLMVSGIMYISGRERSLRAATEFVGALGVNVGAGMILREGTRA